jgi:hypothetical protein
MKKRPTTQDELKKCYRLFMLLAALAIALVAIECLVVMPHLSSLAAQFVIIVLIPIALIGMFALWLRSRLERIGITGPVWIDYCSKQPLSRIVMWGMVIVMIATMLKMLK